MMKPIIISSIESEVLFRPGNNQHAKYYSIITLNQTILSAREPEVANQLLKTYFAVFAGLRQQSDSGPKPKPQGKLSRKAKQRLENEAKAREVEEEHNSKLVSALLTGVNRAYPFSNLDDFASQIGAEDERILDPGECKVADQRYDPIDRVDGYSVVLNDDFARSWMSVWSRFQLKLRLFGGEPGGCIRWHCIDPFFSLRSSFTE